MVAAAFAIRIDDYRLGDTTFFANDRDPRLPAGLASLMSAVTASDTIGFSVVGGGGLGAFSVYAAKHPRERRSS